MGNILNLNEILETYRKKGVEIPLELEEAAHGSEHEPERPKAKKKERPEVPVWHKSNLTLEEAAAYSGIGVNKLRDISNEKDCDFVLFVGTKRLIKRQRFDEYIDKVTTI